MSSSAPWRNMRPHRKTSVLACIMAIGVVGAFSLGTSSAMAADDPAGDTTDTTTLVEAAPTEQVPTETVEEAAPAAPAVAEDPAPVADVVDPAPVTEEPASQPPVESAKNVVPAPNPGGEVAKPAKKVFVCKYVGTPGTDERLQTGNNPISVAVNSIQNNQWNGTVPGWFSDAHDRSYVLAYDTGQPKPNVSSCPSPEVKPEPEVITGTVVFTTATCDAPLNTISAAGAPGGVWTLTDKNGATYKSALGGPVNTGTFPNGGVPGGLAYGSITISLDDNDPNDAYNVTHLSDVWLTVDPSSLECNVNPEPTCVAPEDVTWSYTFDGVGSGTVTASAEGAEQGDELCDPLAVRAATWSYDLPTNGNNPSWAQTRFGYNDLTVNAIGTFAYAAPALNTCRQNDIYAEFFSNGGFESLELPLKLLGPNNPFEPKFLHQALPGAGPNPTWSSTSSEGCNPPPVTPEPKVEFSTWQDVKPPVCGDTSVTQTRTKTTTPYKVIVVDGDYKVVVDTENVTVTTETKTRDLTDKEIEDCKAPPTTPPTTPPVTTPPTTAPPVTTVSNPAPPTAPKGSLASTGTNIAAGLGLTALLLLGGTGLMIASRRRQGKVQDEL